MCKTVDTLHPFQSSIDLDGIDVDRDVVSDIAYDGDPIEERLKTMKKLVAITLFAVMTTGCLGLHLPTNLTIPQVTTILTDAEWGVKEAVSLEWLSAAEGDQVDSIIEATIAVLPSAPSGPQAVAKSALQQFDKRLPTDSRLHVYVEAALTLL